MTRPLMQDAWAVRWEHPGFGLSRTFHTRKDAREWLGDIGMPGKVVRVHVIEVPRKAKRARR